MIVDFETLKIPLRDPQKTPLFFVATQFAQNVHKMYKIRSLGGSKISHFSPHFEVGCGHRDIALRAKMTVSHARQGVKNQGVKMRVFLKFSLRARSLLFSWFGIFEVFLRLGSRATV